MGTGAPGLVVENDDGWPLIKAVGTIGPQVCLAARLRIIKALLDGMIIKYQTKQMIGNLSS